MAKFHINPKTGDAQPCSARTRCPFGDMEDNHYNTVERAREAHEEAQRPGLIPSPMSHERRPNWVELPEGQEASVYTLYRRSLASQRGNVQAKTTAAEKKQRAREEASEHFRLPHSQVKSIVARLQLEANISSVQDDATHQESVAYHRRADALLAAAPRSEADAVACSCGSVDGVKIRLHPVEAEIYGRRVPVLLCVSCYEELELDV